MDSLMRVKNGATSRPRKSTLVAHLLLLVLTMMFAKASAQSGNCTSSPTVDVQDVDVDFYTAWYRYRCSTGSTWTKGTDLCDPDSFVPYRVDDCFQQCIIHREDYISTSPVYFRCGDLTLRINVNAVANFTVPDFLIAGEETTVISLVGALSRPTDFPELTITFQQPNSEGIFIHENVTSYRREVVPNEHMFIHIYSFTIPRTNSTATARIKFSLPDGIITHRALNGVFSNLPVIPGGPEPEPPTTTEPVTIMATTVKQTEQPTSTATDVVTPTLPPTGGFQAACPVGSGAVVGAAVGSAVLTSVVSVVATVLIICCRYKKINQKKHESLVNGIKTSSDAPNSLSLRPLATISDYPTPTPPGITPTMETAHLLASESRRRGSPNRSVSATNRQYSRYSSQASDSPTTTTPNSLAPPTPNGIAPPIYRRMEHNEASAAAAASGPIIVNVTGGTVPLLLDSGAKAGGHVNPESLMPEEISSIGSPDSEKHVYSTIPLTGEQLGQYPPSLRPLPATPPHSNLPSPLVPTAPFEPAVTESPYEKQGETMKLPHQEGD